MGTHCVMNCVTVKLIRTLKYYINEASQRFHHLIYNNELV